jgi:hypothetical protein
MWEIIDDNGTIHSGSEEEMTEAFGAMTYDFKDFCREYSYAYGLAKEIQKKYKTEWSGDLKLIQIHNITK